MAGGCPAAQRGATTLGPGLVSRQGTWLCVCHTRLPGSSGSDQQVTMTGSAMISYQHGRASRVRDGISERKVQG